MPGWATIVSSYKNKKASKSFVCRLTGFKFERTFERRCPKHNEWYEERTGENIAHRADRKYYRVKFWILTRR